VTDATGAEPVRYEADIKPLFRARDQRAMTFALDLYSYKDVSQQADAILAKLQSGTMPCDGPWPEDQVDLFHRWIIDGKQP
jgi:hypothetical protein